ncbi:TetR/AcrR family transcriptional regulator [Streptomyces sp. 4N509B]|uniref:TetR/AcrR family transcriptional regulator n=1 Tax=Streptomyces sp. 4N509B TaxID=3457413 RepID=UPI003FCF8615
MAEHRRMQRAALLGAARSLLTEGGVTALTFPAMARRAGMARSSVYAYFSSRAAVVEELCAADFPLWAAEVEAAMADAASPRDQIEAYVRRQLALAADQRHRAVVAISAGELSAAAREKIRAAHEGLLEMVVGVLRDLGHREPRVTALLVQGVVDAAVRCVDARSPGRDPEDVVAAAVRLVLDGVGERDPGDGQQSGGSGA